MSRNIGLEVSDLTKVEGKLRLLTSIDERLKKEGYYLVVRTHTFSDEVLVSSIKRGSEDDGFRKSVALADLDEGSFADHMWCDFTMIVTLSVAGFEEQVTYNSVKEAYEYLCCTKQSDSFKRPKRFEVTAKVGGEDFLAVFHKSHSYWIKSGAFEPKVRVDGREAARLLCSHMQSGKSFHYLEQLPVTIVSINGVRQVLPGDAEGF